MYEVTELHDYEYPPPFLWIMTCGKKLAIQLNPEAVITVLQEILDSSYMMDESQNYLGTETFNAFYNYWKSTSSTFCKRKRVLTGYKRTNVLFSKADFH